MKSSSRRNFVLFTAVTLLAAAAVYLCLVKALPEKSFWITDGGNKFIITQNILKYGDANIRYPAADIDPEKRFFPYSRFHFNRRGDKIYSIFPCYYPWLAAGAFRCLGSFGLYLLSVISSLLVIFFSAMLIRRLKLPDIFLLPLPLLAFATPLLFYSLTFWEMAFGMIFSTAGVWLLLKDQARNSFSARTLLAGVLLGLGIVFREELYFLAAALAAALLARRVRIKKLFLLGGGLALMVIPLWIVQYLRHGHILGLHGGTYHQHNVSPQCFCLFAWFWQKLNGYFIYLFKFNAWGFETPWRYYILLLPFFAAVIAGFVFSGYRRGKGIKTLILFGAGLAWAILLIMLYSNPDPVLNTIYTVGFITSSPLLLPFWLNVGALLKSRRRGVAFIAFAATLYCILLCPALSQSDMGIIWGPRHFLFLLPLLLPLSMYCLFKMYPRLAAVMTFLLLAGFSLLIQLQGISNLFLMKGNAARLESSVAANARQVIVSDIYWLPTETPTLFLQKKFMQFNGYESLYSLLKLLKKNKIKHFSLVLSQRYQTLNKKQFAAILRHVRITRKFEFVELPGTDFLNVVIFDCELAPVWGH